MKSFLNNIDAKDFNDKYDHWIFDLDNTIYDFNLGLFKLVSSRMTIYIKEFFNLKIIMLNCKSAVIPFAIIIETLPIKTP